MTFLDFCIFATIALVLFIIGAIIVYNKVNRDVGALLGIVSLVIAVVGFGSWITYAASINDQNVDQKYCESLENRGHDTQFFVYNVFNHECYIKVDNQWMEIRDSPFSRGVK